MEEILNTTTEQVNEPLDLSTIKSFKAVNADGTEVEVSTDELVNAITEQVAMNFQAAANSIMPMADTSAQAANDIYENALPVQTSFTHFRTMNGGTSGMATNQKVAEVLGGLIGIDNTWLRRRGYVSYNKLDEALLEGYYNVNGTESDPSITEPGLRDWGTIIVVNNKITTQILIPANIKSVCFIRTKLSSGFTKWSKFTGTLLTI